MHKASVFSSKRAIDLWRKRWIESAAFTDDQLIAFGRGNKPLWAYGFSKKLRVYDRQELTWRLQVVDLLRNGDKGIIAAFDFQDAEAQDQLCLFDGEGKLVWTAEIQPDLAKRDGRPFERAWKIKHMLVVSEPKAQSIWVALANSVGWGGCILCINIDGKSTLRFANAGYVERLGTATVHGERCLVFCGENNDYDCAFVSLLGLDDPLSYSVPGKRTVYRFARETGDRPRKLVLFPRTELIIARQKPYGHTTALREFEGGIIAHVETGGDGAEFLYYFAYDLEPIYVFPSGSHEYAHQDLERKQRLAHTWNNCPELRGPLTLRVWTANTGWTTRPIPWRDNPWKDD